MHHVEGKTKDQPSTEMRDIMLLAKIPSCKRCRKPLLLLQFDAMLLRLLDGDESMGGLSTI